MPSNNPASKPVTQQSNASSPYVGPRPFTQADRDIFFGRTQEAIELTSLVKAHPEVLLYAQSGAGKSSLLFAQVMPILDTEEEFDVLPVGRVRSQESSVIPDQKINNIYMFNVLKDLSGDQLSVMERTQLTLAEFLKRRPRPPVPSRETEDGHKTDTPEHQEKRLARVVIFDQFEEIFTLHPERYKDRQDFFSQVALALKEDPFLRVIFSMREDYIAEVEPYIHVLPQNLRTRYRLERLRKTNAFSAVKQPLETDRCKKQGRYFEEDAAHSLVDRLMLIKVKTASGEKIEAPGEFVDPVQLQVVCQTLWEKLPPNKIAITKDDIDKYANVDEALSDFYENSLRRAIAPVSKPETQTGTAVTAITEAQVRGWFEQKLITREGKRNMVFRERETTAGLDNGVVDELENCHVVRVEMRGGEPWYELSHDRFIPPIRESNRRFLLKQPLAKRKAQELETRADEWLASGRSNDLLLNRGELVDAQNWMNTDAAAIGYSETLFSLIRASEAAIEHEDKKQQQLLAEAQERRVLAEQQRSRQMKLGFLVTSVLLVCTLFSTGVAFNRWRTATSAQIVAHNALQEATESNAKATKNYAEAQQALATSRINEQKAQQAADELALANAREAEERRKADAARKFAEEQKAAADIARGQTEVALRETKSEQDKTQAALVETKRLNDELTGFTKNLEDSRNEAWSYALASYANSVVLQDPELALRLALEATKRKATDQAKVALARAYLKFGRRSILKGHEDSVRNAVYGPNGQVFSVSEDSSIRIWDPKTAKEQQKLETGAAAHAFTISSDGTWLATEQANSTGRIWNLRNGTLKVLPNLSGPVAALALSNDGSLLATEATEEGGKPGATPRIWKVDSGKELTSLKGHGDAVVSIAFSPNGDLVATGSWDTTARIWDAKTGREVAILKGHTDPLTSVAFDGTGQLLVTASFDGTARVWEVATGTEKWVLRGHKGVVQSALFSPDNRRIVTAGKTLSDRFKSGTAPVPLSAETKKRLGTVDNTARIWNVGAELPTGNLLGHSGGINSAVFSSDGKLIVTASDDHTAIVWNVARQALITKLQGHEGPVNTAVFDSKNSSILTASDDGTAQVWNLKNIGQIRFEADKKTVLSVDSPRNDLIVTGSVDGNVRFWDFKGFQKTGGMEIDINSVLSPEQAPGGVRVYDIAVSPNSDSVVTSSVVPIRRVAYPDNNAHVWNTKTKKFEHELQGHNDPVIRVLFSPTGRYLATMSRNRAQVWNTSNFNTPIKVIDSASRMVNIAFSANEESFLTAGDDGSLSIAKMGTENTTQVKLPTNISRTAFSGDGKRIAVASTDRRVVVWDITTKEKVSILRAYPGTVAKLAFSSDDKLLLTANLNAKIFVWNAESGELVQELESLDEPLSSLIFGNENRSIIAAGSQGGIYVVECELCHPFPEVVKLACEKNPRELTFEEFTEYMPKEKDFLAGKKVCENPQ
jgi:WD40 repeat protein